MGAFAFIQFDHGRSMVPFHLLLAELVAIRVQESDSR
jgi:hypothetical protein